MGTNFTASTPLPAKSDGTPLCLLPQFRKHLPSGRARRRASAAMGQKDGSQGRHAGFNRQRRCARGRSGMQCGGARSLVMIMGTSICHMLLGTEKQMVEGMCGTVKEDIVPGFWGFEAG